MKLPPYPDYKRTDVEWLGDVPTHWQVDRLKRSIDYSQNGVWGAEPDGGEDDVVCIRVADFDRNRFRVISKPPTLRAISRTERSSRTLSPGDLLIEKSGGGEKQLVGCVVSFDHSFEAVSSNFIARMRPSSGMNSRYWAYAHASMYSGRLNYPSIKQTTGIQNLDTGAYLNECFVFPPSDEQRAIADFLDRETSRLDTLVGKKRELIEKLKEKRTALISRSVTRGLNPTAKLKPSGVEWLGDIPEHWEAAQLRRKSIVLDCKHKTVSFVDDGIPIASIREVHGFEVDLSQAKKTTEEEYLEMIEGERKPRVGDIIYSRNATVGDAAQVTVKEPFCLGQDVCLIRAPKHHSRYLLYLFRSAPLLEQVESLMIGSTFRRINVGQIKAFWMSIPPLPEQCAIASDLDRETAKIDRMTEKVEAAIEKLREYRTALITAAVTGKIDVRNGPKFGCLDLRRSPN
jgi:type I restriction enzyme S subunit